MSNEPVMAESPETPSFAPRLYGIAALVAAIVIIGLWLVARFTQFDLARDMQTWQEKLNLIAESRTADVNNWVAGNFKELRTLAENPSLQLYMTELQVIKPGEDTPAKDKPTLSPEAGGEAPQKTYLRNLLLFTAERAGFSAPVNNNGVASIPANVQQNSKNGLAVLNATGDMVVSTVMQPAMRDLLLEHAHEALAGQESLIDIRKDSDGTPYIGFVVPIYAIQGEHDGTAQIGRVVGIKTVDNNLFSLLKHPGVTESTLEAILVRVNNDKIEYISPLQDGTTPLSKTNALDTEKFTEAKLVQTVGGFTSDKKDYRDKMSLATSRSIIGTPWTLVVKIDRTEAFAQSQQRRASMVVFFFLIIAIIVLIIVAIWWHAHSKRAMLMSAYFRKLANWATAQEQLLRLVADNQPEPIYIVDKMQKVHFANQKAAADTNMTLESVPGKALADVRGAARAEAIGEQCDNALRHKRIAYDVQRTHHGSEEKVVRSAYVPLDHIPVADLPRPTPGVLVVEQDISDVVHEREQRLKTHHQLVETLVKLVDKRDPFSANHSLLVSQIAHEVANDMELDNITVETTRTAGSLMNIGKIIVPRDLLTKTDSLTMEEKTAIRDSMNAAADLIKEISFPGPVAETLRQWQEKMDGSGPLGLKGEQILISARIIAVANAFIGMISPRSWRNALPIDTATKTLLDQSGREYDRRVVIALVNYLENHHGKTWLNKVIEGNKAA